jgi:hypothetical protein
MPAGQMIGIRQSVQRNTLRQDGRGRLADRQGVLSGAIGSNLRAWAVGGQGYWQRKKRLGQPATTGRHGREASA